LQLFQLDHEYVTEVQEYMKKRTGASSIHVNRDYRFVVAHGQRVARHDMTRPKSKPLKLNLTLFPEDVAWFGFPSGKYILGILGQINIVLLLVLFLSSLLSFGGAHAGMLVTWWRD